MSLIKSKEEAAVNVLYGKPIHLKIRFALQYPLPKIHELYFNGQLLCSEPKGKLKLPQTMILFSICNNEF